MILWKNFSLCFWEEKQGNGYVIFLGIGDVGYDVFLTKKWIFGNLGIGFCFNSILVLGIGYFNFGYWEILNFCNLVLWNLNM